MTTTTGIRIYMKLGVQGMVFWGEGSQFILQRKRWHLVFYVIFQANLLESLDKALFFTIFSSGTLSFLFFLCIPISLVLKSYKCQK